MKYRIIYADSHVRLQACVQDMLEEGRVPLGGPLAVLSAGTLGASPEFYQAVTCDESETP